MRRVGETRQQVQGGSAWILGFHPYRTARALIAILIGGIRHKLEIGVVRHARRTTCCPGDRVRKLDRTAQEHPTNARAFGVGVDFDARDSTGIEGIDLDWDCTGDGCIAGGLQDTDRGRDFLVRVLTRSE